MLWNLLEFVALAAIIKWIYKYFFSGEPLITYKYPFTEPGSFYYLNYAIYRIWLALFHKRQKRFNFWAGDGDTPKDIGVLIGQKETQCELQQVKPQKTDELRLSGMSVDGHSLDVAISSSKNSTHGRCWLYFTLKTDSGVKSYELLNSSQTVYKNKSSQLDLWQGDDLKIWCLAPMMKWRVYYNGFLKDSNTGKVDYVRFSFVWKPYTRTMDHMEIATDCVLAKAFAKSPDVLPKNTASSVLNQYDQWGVYYGYYAINGDTQENTLVLRGNKTRHFGKFDWSDVHKYVDFKVYFEDGTVASLSMISLKNEIPEMIWGYVVLANGVVQRIKSTDFQLPIIQSHKQFPSMFSITLNTDGEKFILTFVSESEPKSNTWGSIKWPCIDISVSNVKVSMTNASELFIVPGKGILHYGVARDSVTLEDPSSSAENMINWNVTTSEVDKQRMVLGFEEQACRDLLLTGGKGSSLAMLTAIAQQKFKVPDGFCITIAAYDSHVCSHADIQQAIRDVCSSCSGKNKESIEDACNKLSKLLSERQISSNLRLEVAAKLVKQFGSEYEKERFSVRSSAAGEDGEEISGAGQMETFLGCKGIDQICSSVIKCWASLYSPRAVQYRRQYGQRIDVGMCVVVQKMVSADIAGVLFSRHPSNGNPGLMNISANSGLGESVVSAACDPDMIDIKRTFDDQLSIGDIVLGKKQMKIVMNDENGVETVQMDENEQVKCCLTDQQILQLAQVGVYVERCYGDPRDIEWAFANGQLYLLQSRPITALDNMNDFDLINEYNTPLMSDFDQITSGNVKEVLPGALSPLFHSYGDQLFIRFFSRLKNLTVNNVQPGPLMTRASFTHQWHRFFNRSEMGFAINHKYKTQEQENMEVGFDIAISGRILSINPISEALAIQRSRYASKYEKLKNYICVMLSIYRTKNSMQKMYETYADLDLNLTGCRNAHELATALFSQTEYFTEAMHLHVRITLSSVFLNSAIFNELVNIAGINPRDVNEQIYGDFASLIAIDNNSDQVLSADVPSALANLAKVIKASIDKEKFDSMSKQEAVDWLSSDSSPVKKVYDNFIEKHGHRCLKEFDFLSKTWSMDPTQIIDPLKPLVRDNKTTNIRKLNIDQALEKLSLKLTPKQRKSLRKTVLSAREFVAYREQAKSLLIRTVHEYRKSFIRLGEMMVSEGRLPDPQLVMFMSPEEIMTLLDIRSPGVIQRAMRRRKLHAQLDKNRYPEISYGFPKLITRDQTTIPTDGAVVIEGIPVSKGIVEAPARVVLDITEAGCIQSGDILITAATDIAWSPFFPSLGGVVTEIGGLISHGAVVAREYGIPCVVGAENATIMFKSGDMIRLNGNTGRIEKIQDSN